jgi:hypothetical protein
MCSATIGKRRYPRSKRRLEALRLVFNARKRKSAKVPSKFILDPPTEDVQKISHHEEVIIYGELLRRFLRPAQIEHGAPSKGRLEQAPSAASGVARSHRSPGRGIEPLDPERISDRREINRHLEGRRAARPQPRLDAMG